MGAGAAVAFLGTFFLQVSALAAPITYTAARSVGTGSADISITTDGTTGVLSSSDIIGWTITVKNGTDSFTLLGPQAAVPNSQILLRDDGLSATAANLIFNFSDPDYLALLLIQKGIVGSSESFYEDNAYYSSERVLAAPNLFTGSLTSSTRPGFQVIASNAALPPNCTSADPNYFSKIGSFSAGGASVGGNFNFNLGVRSGCTLPQIAQSYGYDHFNFIQIATSYPRCPLGPFPSGSIIPVGAPPAFIDPPIGGYFKQPGDNYPYYYGEPGTNDAYPLSAQVNGNFLQWTDEPIDRCAVNGAEMRFTTSLVGVYANETHSNPLETWTWGSNASCDGYANCGDAFLAGKNSGIDFTGGITYFAVLDDPLAVPSSALPFLLANDVPEPLTLSLFAAGLGGIFLARRKRPNGPHKAL